ncbi:MAG: hypothetical protein E3J81_03545 [Dehalococcoidia bacterium]|nr:MAG: hypothetical protein E3J81_03545 [Dehalococcoidia bacterium]
MKYLKLHTGHVFDDFGCAIFKKFGPDGHSTWIVLMCLWANDSADVTYRTGEDRKKVPGTYAEYHLTEIAKFCRRQPAQVLKLIQWLDDRGHFHWENRPQFEELHRQIVGKLTAGGRRIHGTWTALERQVDGKICIFWPNIVKHNRGYYHFLSLLSSSKEEGVSQPKSGTENVDNSKSDQPEKILTLVNLSRTLFADPLSQGQAGALLKSVDGNYRLAEQKVQEAKSKKNPITWLMAFAHRPERYEKEK